MQPLSTVFRVEQLQVSQGLGRLKKPVLWVPKLDIASHQWVCVVGANGAGKSTLLSALAGVMPFEGHIWFKHQPLQSIQPRVRAQTLAWLGQSGMQGAGADHLSVYDVAMLGRLPHQAWLAAPTAADHAAVGHALQQMKALAWRDRRFGALSGGERQRVLLARLLAVQASVMLMDEPLAHLDPPHQADWIALVRQCIAQQTTVVSVLHDISIALMSDHLIILHQGQVVYAGPTQHVQARQTLQNVFENRLTLHKVDHGWLAQPCLSQ